MLFTKDEAARLKATGDPNDNWVADIIKTSLATPPEISRREPGKPHEVFLLNKDEGFVLPAPIAHPVGAAWLRGQRYTRSDALKTNPATTEQLAAAGG